LFDNFVLLKRGFLKNATFIAVARGVVKIKGLLMAPLIISALGKEGYGVWIQAFVTITLVSSLAEMNLHGALVRFGAGKKDKKELTTIFYQILSLGLVFSLISGVLIILFAKPLAIGVLKSPPTEKLLKIGAALVVFLVGEKICHQLFRAQEQFKKYAGITLVVAVLEIIGVFLGLRIIQDPIAVLVGVSVANLIVVITLLCFIFARFDIRLFRWEHAKVKQFMKLAVPTLPTLLSSWIFTYVDRYFLSFYRDAGEVGIYSLAYTLGGLPFFFIGPLGTVLLPSLSRLWDEKKISESKKVLRSSIILYLGLGILVWLIIAIFAQPLLTFISTQHEFGIQGRWIAPIIGLSTVFYGVIFLLNYVFFLIKKTYYITLVFGTGALVNLISNLWAVPQYGSVGAAITTLLSFTVMLIITALISKRLTSKYAT